VGFSELRNNAQDDDEAHTIRDAVERTRAALAEAGYATR
jgi:hypothetical protein